MKKLFLLLSFFTLLTGCATLDGGVETNPVSDPIPGDYDQNGIMDQFENAGPSDSTDLQKQ